MSGAITVSIDGRVHQVSPGTTVAVALLDAGTPAFHTSVRGAPRGPVCGIGVCFECRVTIDGQPHQRACLVPCQQGMDIRTGRPTDG